MYYVFFSVPKWWMSESGKDSNHFMCQITFWCISFKDLPKNLLQISKKDKNLIERKTVIFHSIENIDWKEILLVTS